MRVLLYHTHIWMRVWFEGPTGFGQSFHCIHCPSYYVEVPEEER